VWLPAGYERSDERSDGRSDERSGDRYPVLYMHDGQNLFEPETAFNKGEHWRVGETAAELIEAGRIVPPIIVGIYNTGEMRIDEYTPTTDTKLGGGQATTYGRMIVEELKPLVDRTYRTQTDRASTGIAGSSLGGLASLHLAFNHPAVFRQGCGALAVGVVGSKGDPENDPRGAIETEIARVGRHGNGGGTPRSR
jgi:predicted alpha/beta superfamily hydrolase